MRNDDLARAARELIEAVQRHALPDGWTALEGFGEDD
jgi:hypothetical protein